MSKSSHEGTAHKYERTDAAPLSVGVTLFLFVIFIWVLLASGEKYFHYLKSAASSTTGVESSVLAERKLPPGPRIQEHPREELEAYLDREKKFLGSYGWIDRRSGIVHIPISRAMEIFSHARH